MFFFFSKLCNKWGCFFVFVFLFKACLDFWAPQLCKPWSFVRGCPWQCYKLYALSELTTRCQHALFRKTHLYGHNFRSLVIFPVCETAESLFQHHTSDYCGGFACRCVRCVPPPSCLICIAPQSTIEMPACRNYSYSVCACLCVLYSPGLL